MECINVSHHDHFKLAKDLSINNSEIIINCLKENHVVNVHIEWITDSSESFDAVFLNVFHDFFDLIWLVISRHLFDQDFEKFDKLWVVVVNTEIEAVKQSHGILFQVLSMLENDVGDLVVEFLLLQGHFLAKSVCLFKSVSNLVMEINLLSELLEVVFLDFFIHFVHDLILSFVNLNYMFDVVNQAVIVEIISS